jgi:hypothetical protein
MRAYEKGRNLIIDIGDENEEGFVRVTVKPIPAKLGAALYALWLGIAFGQAEDLELSAENMGKLAVGEENWPTIEGDELRWEETEKVIHAAFFWNVQGGGMDMVNTLLEQNGSTGGYPKAQAELVKRNGHSTAFAQLTTLLSSVEAAETPSPADTSGTSTPSGSVT